MSLTLNNIIKVLIKYDYIIFKSCLLIKFLQISLSWRKQNKIRAVGRMQLLNAVWYSRWASMSAASLQLDVRFGVVHLLWCRAPVTDSFISLGSAARFTMSPVHHLLLHTVFVWLKHICGSEDVCYKCKDLMYKINMSML